MRLLAGTKAVAAVERATGGEVGERRVELDWAEGIVAGDEEGRQADGAERGSRIALVGAC